MSHVNTSPEAQRIRLEFAPDEHCHSGMDGECYWSQCPQERNGRADYLFAVLGRLKGGAMRTLSVALLLVAGCVASGTGSTDPDQQTSGGPGGSSAMDGGHPPRCQGRNMANEPCNQAEGDPLCVERCCDQAQGVDSTAPAVSTYCTKFPLVDNCFDASEYATSVGQYLQNGFAYCQVTWGLTCGACYDPFMACWMQGCAHTH